MDPKNELARRVLAGDVRAIARVLRLVDDRSGEFLTVLKELFRDQFRAPAIVRSSSRTRARRT